MGTSWDILSGSFGVQQADVLAGAVVVLVALGQFAGNFPVLNLGSVTLDVGQNGFAGAIDAAQVQAGVQVVGHDPAVRVLHILGQGVDVVQDAGNVGRNLVCGLGCPVGLTGCTVLQGYRWGMLLPEDRTPMIPVFSSPCQIR